MFETIKSLMLIIDNRVNFGISPPSLLKGTEVKYFIEILDKKGESQKYYVEKHEFDDLRRINEEKQQEIKRRKVTVTKSYKRSPKNKTTQE